MSVNGQELLCAALYAKAFLKAINPSTGVDQLLLAGEKGMAA